MKVSRVFSELMRQSLRVQARARAHVQVVFESATIDAGINYEATFRRRRAQLRDFMRLRMVRARSRRPADDGHRLRGADHPSTAVSWLLFGGAVYNATSQAGVVGGRQVARRRYRLVLADRIVGRATPQLMQSFCRRKTKYYEE